MLAREVVAAVVHHGRPPSAPRSNFDQSARIAALESRLAAIRRAIHAQGPHRHNIIIHGRQYAAYDYGEAPADGAERAEQEGMKVWDTH